VFGQVFAAGVEGDSDNGTGVIGRAIGNNAAIAAPSNTGVCGQGSLVGVAGFGNNVGVQGSAIGTSGPSIAVGVEGSCAQGIGVTGIADGIDPAPHYQWIQQTLKVYSGMFGLAKSLGLLGVS
jgi:hypothetical protein